MVDMINRDRLKEATRENNIERVQWMMGRRIVAEATRPGISNRPIPF